MVRVDRSRLGELRPFAHGASLRADGHADDREEKGDPRLANPELLVLAAASSCQMLWFLHLAAKARIDVVAYEDDCEAEMPDDRIERIVLRPKITISGDASEERVLKLCEQAHRQCNVAKSLSCPVELEPRLL